MTVFGSIPVLHTLASALSVVLHVREVPVGEDWCESEDLSELSFRLYAPSRCSHLAVRQGAEYEIKEWE